MVLAVHSGDLPITQVDDAAETRAVAQRSPFARWIRTNGAWVLFVDIALIALFGLLSEGHVFLTVQNFQAIAMVATPSRLRSNDAVEPSVVDRPNIRRTGPAIPPAATTAASHGRSLGRRGDSVTS